MFGWRGVGARCGRLRSGLTVVDEGASAVACRQPRRDPLPGPEPAGGRRWLRARDGEALWGKGSGGLAVRGR
ncbi:MAG: hypothetical protein OXG81_04670 [Acidobacteria bacterium]|nr:hypothetical protein [Acidobacteriota bacterium]